MMKAKVEFLWYKPGEKIAEEEGEYFDQWLADGLIESEEEEKVEEPKLDLDVNDDGVVDKKDASIMASHLCKRGGRPKKK